MMIGATVFCCWLVGKLKRVSIDDRNLYLSNCIKEISIPFSEREFADDSQGVWPVIVRLKVRSGFGSTVLFIATWKPFIFSKTHPIVEEIRGNITNVGLRWEDAYDNFSQTAIPNGSDAMRETKFVARLRSFEILAEVRNTLPSSERTIPL